MLISILIALSLAMDSFTVSLAIGSQTLPNSLFRALKTGLFFGFFQMLMSIIGWLLGNQLKQFVSGFDHWLAFFLLTAIGGRMIYESHKKNKESQINLSTNRSLLLLSVATSIDALILGVSFAFIKINLIYQIALIGTVTFLLSFLGVGLGKVLKKLFGNKALAAGGLILIILGLKILLQHMF